MTGRPRTVSDAAVHAVVARVVTRVGPSGLTLATVGREAGLSPAGLVARFGSKRGLLLSFAAQAPHEVARVFAEAEDRFDSPLEALHGALAQAVAGISSREAMAHNLAFLHLDLTDPEFRTYAIRHARTARARLRHLCDRAVAVGELHFDTRTDDLADAVHTTYQGALLTWAVDGRGRLRPWVRRHVEATLAPHRTVPTG